MQGRNVEKSKRTSVPPGPEAALHPSQAPATDVRSEILTIDFKKTCGKCRNIVLTNAAVWRCEILHQEVSPSASPVCNGERFEVKGNVRERKQYAF